MPLEQVRLWIDAVLAISVATGIVLGAYSLRLLVRGLRQHEVALNAAQAEAAERLTTELYLAAVKQIASDKTAVRLAGVYALERLGQNTPSMRQVAVDVLCAYLRAPYVEEQSAIRKSGDRRRDPRDELSVRLAAQRVISSHLRVKPNEPSDTFWPAIRLDLVGAHLVDFNLSSCHMRSADFSEALFTGRANFEDSVLTGDLFFKGCKFDGEAYFAGLVAGQILFEGALFVQSVTFREAIFSGYSSFEGANFVQNVEFARSSFLEPVDFLGVRFGWDADFSRCLFSDRARFDGSLFNRDADFTHASFISVSFDGCLFTGTLNLTSAVLSRDGQNLVARIPRMGGEATEPGRLYQTARGLIETYSETGLEPDLDSAIDALRLLLATDTDGSPDHPDALADLGASLHSRFQRKADPGDLEDAIGALRQAIDLAAPASPVSARALSNLGIALRARFELSGAGQDLEEAIGALTQAVKVTPPSSPERASRLSNLGIALRASFEYSGDASALEIAIANLRQSIALTSADSPEFPQRLSNLALVLASRFDAFGDQSSVDEAVFLLRRAIAVSPTESNAAYASNLAAILYARYSLRGTVADLDEAIAVLRALPGGTAHHENLREAYLSNLATLEGRRRQVVTGGDQ